MKQVNYNDRDNTPALRRRIPVVLIVLMMCIGITGAMTIPSSIGMVNAQETPVDTADIVSSEDTVDTVNNADSVDNAGTADNVDSVNNVDSADNADNAGNVDDVDSSSGDGDTIEAGPLGDDIAPLMSMETADASVKPMRAAGNAERMTIKDMLDTDSAYVSELKVLNVVSGSAPFDSDNNPGNDADASNGIIRSFDDAVYNLQVITTSDDPMTYYRKSRVGIRITLPVNDQKAQFDVNSMGWVDRSAGYEPKVVKNADGTQTLTVYRLLEPNTNNDYTVPSSSTLNIPVRIKAMLQGETIKPEFEAWMVPNTTTNRVAKAGGVPVLTVSSTPRFNIRVPDIQSSEKRKWNFDEKNPNGGGYYAGLYDSDDLNDGLGEMQGILQFTAIGIDIRNSDVSKKIKGTELPDGDIEFDMVVNTTHTSLKGKKETVHSNVPEAQSYFWCIGAFGALNGVTKNENRIGGCQNLDRAPKLQSGWVIRNDGIDLSGSVADHTKGDETVNAISYNGSMEVAQKRSDDNTTLHVTIHGAAVNDINDLPQCAWASGTCEPGKKGYFIDGNGDIRIGAISSIMLLSFIPTQIDGKDFVDYYDADSVSYKTTYNAVNIRATGKSGTTTTKDIITGDTTKSAGGDMINKGNFQPNVYYACTVDNMKGMTTWENPSDCVGWQSSQLNTGTDTTLQGGSQYVNTGYLASPTMDTEYAPVLSMVLSKFDDKVFHVNKDLELFASSAMTQLDEKYGTTHVNGTWTHNNNANGYTTKNILDIYYAVKDDGTGWTSDDEQANTNLSSPNLRYYKDYDEAKSHGVIVGLLFASRYSMDMNKTINIYMNPVYKLYVNDGVKAGTTAATTAEAWVYTRGQLKALSDKAPDPYQRSDANDKEWSSYANTQDPYDLFFTEKIKPGRYWAGTGYKKSTYEDGYYHPSNHEGKMWGDTTLIVAERPYMNIGLAQYNPGTTEKKKLYDLDRDERTVDYRIVFRVDANKMNRDKTTDVVLTVDVPKGLKYMDASAYHSDNDNAYKQDETGKQPGTVTGGTQVNPKVVNNANGTQTLTFTVPNIPTNNTYHNLWFTANIGDAGDPENDVKNNEEFTVKATVTRTTGNFGVPTTTNSRIASVSMRVSKTLMSSISTKADPLINEVNDPIRFINRFGNYSDTPVQGYGISIMPKNNAYGSSYAGTYAFDTLKLEALNGASLDNAVVRMTTDQKYLDADPLKLTTGEVDQWTQVPVNKANGTVTIPASMRNATAFVVSSPLNKGNQISMTFTLQPENAKPGNIYVNRFSDMDNTVRALATMANRTVSGVAWYDKDEDGARNTDNGDKLLRGVKVKLINAPIAGDNASIANAQPITTLTGEPASTTTNEDGEYRFEALPAGDYMLVFQPSEGSEWTPFSTTTLKAENVSESNNNDASGVYLNAAANKMLTATTIPVSMPKLKDMTSSRYADEFLDSGIKGLLPLGSAPAIIPTVKNLTGRSFAPGEAFYAVIVPQKGAPTDDGIAPIDGLVGNDDSNPIQIRYTENNETIPLGIDDTKFTNAGTYSYIVSEVDTRKNSVVYDTTKYLVQVMVTENTDTMQRFISTTITNQTSGEKASSIAFNNKYIGTMTDMPMTGGQGIIIITILIPLITGLLAASIMRARRTR